MSRQYVTNKFPTGRAVRLAVFDGRDCVGFVQHVDDRWLAFDLDGEVIGTFSSQPLATRALGERP
jgi:hypothetical protein